jgi:hypothetical protein
MGKREGGRIDLSLTLENRYLFVEREREREREKQRERLTTSTCFERGTG